MQHTVVMTGASRGIGRIAAEQILRRSPGVHLLVVVRGSQGARLAAELSEGAHRVSHVSADLGSLESVKSAAAGIRERLERGDLPPLRGFVGNAGGGSRPRKYCRPGRCWTVRVRPESPGRGPLLR
ncbi:hypothetical protein STENM327S_06384 [Streptomyces tendae]